MRSMNKKGRKQESRRRNRKLASVTHTECNDKTEFYENMFLKVGGVRILISSRSDGLITSGPSNQFVRKIR